MACPGESEPPPQAVSSQPNSLEAGSGSLTLRLRAMLHRRGSGAQLIELRQAGGSPEMLNRYDLSPKYGNDAPWTNVVWNIIGILCACGVVALPFLH